ncbi:Ribonuclease H-like domain [Trinorchestia longiramus]|nr:Ribonuclease H-like domain [Trinorchestia longiramus]
MKPSLLKRHFETNHADKKNRDHSYFQRLGENVKRQRIDKTSQIYQKGASVDIADQVVEGVKSSKYGFAIQLDESTDVTNCSQLLVYVRFTQNNGAKTELLLSQDLSSTTTGKDIFNVLENFCKQNELDWGKLVGCTTYRAPSMLGRKSGFQAHAKAVAPNATTVHCFIHRFALCAKVLPPKSLSCFNRVIRIVNFVKTSALNTRLFKLLCEDFGSNHICLLYPTEVRWLSRDNTTRRLFEPRDELLVFFTEKEHDFQKVLEDEKFTSRLAYLSDIFGALNHLNLSFQGPDCTATVHLEAGSVCPEAWSVDEEPRHAVPQLLIFPSTWECEQGFSACMTIKSKSRNRLDAPEHDFRCAVSKIMPRIDQLVEKQIHPSH